jgi:hypothetical protein
LATGTLCIVKELVGSSKTEFFVLAVSGGVDLNVPVFAITKFFPEISENDCWD